MNKNIENIAIPEISSFKSRGDWEDACWQKILESRWIFKFITTPHEKHDLIMRTAALKLIQSGKSYRQIGQELWLSPQTVSGIHKAIKENNYKSYFERGKKDRKRKNYSSDKKISPKKPEGIPRPTKYGTIYMKPIR